MKIISKIFARNWIPPFVLLFFLALTFYRLPQTFFQQDEWREFGKFAILEQNLGEGMRLVFLKTFTEHLIPGDFILWYLQYRLFHLNFPPYALLSLGLHFLNSLLVYYLVLIISRKKSLSLVVGLLFITNSIAHQATTWISTSISTQGAVFFSLISIIMFFNYLKSKQQKTALFLLALLFFLISLSFRESSIFLFIFFPIFWFLFSSEKTFSKLRKILLTLFFVFFLYFLIRGIFLFININIENQIVEIASTAQIQPSISTYIYRILILPFKVLPQSMFTTTFLMDLSNNLVLTAYPHWLVASGGVANPYIVESVGFDYISFVLSIFILLFAFFIFKLLKEARDQNGIKLLKFSLIFIIASFLPYIFLPGRSGFISISEPRYLYFSGIGVSIFLGLGILTISPWLAKKLKLKQPLLIASLFVFFFLFLHINKIWKDIKALEERSVIRKNILEKIIFSHPTLPSKVVFYTESDTAYYGLPDEEKILPFQSGFGRTLLVWYYGRGEKIPACFFKNEWLYYIPNKDQDYKECEGRGLGYFRKLDTLKKALSENNLLPENVIAFSWDSKNNKFLEITENVRTRLEEESF